MRKIALTAAALALVAFQAQASDGTITFSGAVQTTTCTPTVNGGSASQTVTLPTLQLSAFANVNDEAGLTPFTISIGGGTCAATTATVGFEPTVGSLTAGDLSATKATTGLGLTLKNSSGGAIDLSKAAGSQGAGSISLSGTPATGTGTYYVAYKRLGALAAGAVSATLAYSVSYN